MYLGLLFHFYSSLITHHSSLNFSHPFGIITQYFSYHLWAPYLSLGVFFFFFCPVPRNPNAVKEERKKKKFRSPEPSEKKKKTQEKKRKKKIQKVWLSYD